MSLANYANAARKLAQELATALDEADVAALREELWATDLIDWLGWRRENVRLVAEFVAATPSVRAKRASWHRDRLRLSFAGYQQCMEAAALLETAMKLVPGGSYRALTAEAGLAAQTLQDEDWPDWPWDDPYPWEG